MLEFLVHVTEPSLLPDSIQLLKIAVPPQVSVEILDSRQLSEAWRENQRETQRLGDQWLASQRTALLGVPSAPSPKSTNYLLNPLHPDAAMLEIAECERIQMDLRLNLSRN